MLESYLGTSACRLLQIRATLPGLLVALQYGHNVPNDGIGG